MLLHRHSLEFNKHCRFLFGTHIQAHDEPKPRNTLQSRTLDCAYLPPMTSWQDENELLHISTNCVIMRHMLTELPITNDILTFLENLAMREKYQ